MLTQTIQSHEEQALAEAFAALETALLSPVVSGELENWAETAYEAVVELREPLSQFTKVILKKDYAQIKEGDPELLTRVQKMTEEDKAILGEVAELERDLAALTRRAPQVGSDEQKLEGVRERVEKRGTDCLLRIKRQQAAVAIWLNEALNRDRGVGD